METPTYTQELQDVYISDDILLESSLSNIVENHELSILLKLSPNKDAVSSIVYDIGPLFFNDVIDSRISSKYLTIAEATASYLPSGDYLAAGDYLSSSTTVVGKRLSADVTADDIADAIGLSNYSLTSHAHSGYVLTSTTVAGKSLSSSVNLASIAFKDASGITTKSYNGTSAVAVSLSDIGGIPTSCTVAGIALTGNVTVGQLSDALKLSGYSLTSHTHPNYVLSSFKLNNHPLSGSSLTLDANDISFSINSLNFIDSEGSMVTSYNGTSAVNASIADLGGVASSIKVAGQQLTADVSPATVSSAIGLSGYSLTSHTHDEYVLTSFTVAGKELSSSVSLGTLSLKDESGSTLASYDGSRDIDIKPTSIGCVPESRTVAGKELTSNVLLGSLRLKDFTGSVKATYDGSADIDFSVNDMGIVPSLRMVAGQELTGDVSLGSIDFKDGSGNVAKTYDGTSHVDVSLSDFGFGIAVVEQLPQSPSENVLYFVTGSN